MALLENISHFQLTLSENIALALLTLSENRLPFRLFVTFDTVGEVSSGYAAAPSAISRANGVIRVLARAVSRLREGLV